MFQFKCLTEFSIRLWVFAVQIRKCYDTKKLRKMQWIDFSLVKAGQ